MRGFISLCLLLGLLAVLTEAEGITCPFENITHNVPAGLSVGEYQFYTAVESVSNQLVRFTVRNIGTDPANITEIYIDDRSGVLGGVSSSGFLIGASPSNLPGGSTCDPPFSSTYSFEAALPQAVYGIGPGESVAITFLLGAGRTYEDVTAALNLGALRIGLHAGFADGFTDACVNVNETLYGLQTHLYTRAGDAFVFLTNRKGQHAWAGQGYGAVCALSVNDNDDSQALGTPEDTFSGNQGLVVVYDVRGDSESGSLCALTTLFSELDGTPGYSGLPTNLKDSVLQVDAAFALSEDPGVTLLTNSLGFRLVEADGDAFETGALFDVGRNWQTYSYTLNDFSACLVNAAGNGVYGDSPAVYLALQFHDPNTPAGVHHILYLIDNVQVSGAVDYAEDFEDRCLSMPAGDLNLDCTVDLEDFIMLADNWLAVHD